MLHENARYPDRLVDEKLGCLSYVANKRKYTQDNVIVYMRLSNVALPAACYLNTPVAIADVNARSHSRVVKLCVVMIKGQSEEVKGQSEEVIIFDPVTTDHSFLSFR